MSRLDIQPGSLMQTQPTLTNMMQVDKHQITEKAGNYIIVLLLKNYHNTIFLLEYNYIYYKNYGASQ